jgi:RNA polymerase sigma-70 factor (ECF subfamily)
VIRDPRPVRLVSEPAHLGGPPVSDEPSQLDDGVSRALESLIGRFDAFIRRSARRHGLDGADADEVVQELRLRVWKSLGTAELIRRAKPRYVYRAAVSASLDIIRRRRARRFQSGVLDDAPAASLADPRVRADAGLDRSDLSAAVHRALSLLPESRRGVIRMYLAGYDRHEIEALMGWTEAKTRNLLYRGLEDLRRILVSWGITPEGER